MANEPTQRFGVRREIGAAWIFFLVFGLMLPAAAALFVLVDHGGGLLLGGFALCVLALMGYAILAPGAGYRVDGRTVRLRRGATVRSVPLSQLSGARILSADEAQQILRQYMAPVVAAEARLDARGWARSSLHYGRFLRFCTVPVVQQRRTVGSFRNVVSFGARTGGRLLILRLTAGEELLLSPTDPEALSVCLRRGGAGHATVPLQDAARGAAGQTLDPARDSRRRITRMSLATGAVLAVALATYVILGRPDPQGAVSTATEQVPPPATSWLDADTYQTVITTSSAVVTLLSQEEARRASLENALGAAYVSAIAGHLLNDFLQRTGREIDSDTHQRLLEALMRQVEAAEVSLSSLEVDPQVTEITGVFETYAPGLRQTVTATLLTGAPTTR